jgi:pilus assembly protein CpaF
MKISESELNKINSSITEYLKNTSEPDDFEFRKIIARSVSQSFNFTPFGLREKQEMVEEIFSRIRGLDILQPLFENDAITEIMVNGPGDIFFEESGHIKKYNRSFNHHKHLNDLIYRLFSAENRNICESEPIADVRLKDGSRANAVLYPIAPDGPVLTIRKFSGIHPNIDSLLEKGFLTRKQADYLIKSVINKTNMLISGGTGTGKTTFLNVLSGFIPPDERIITIEDSAELKLQNTPNIVRLESRNALPGTDQSISISDLIRCALRMRPDRIIVGEVRGKEACDMLWAMNTGHPGSLSTGHSNSALDMLARLCVMVQQASTLPVDVINTLIASAVHKVIHLKRVPGGGRSIDSIINVVGYQRGVFEVEKIF